jgi:hypothetical protein
MMCGSERFGKWPTDLHRRKLKELAERLDHFHSFAKVQFVKWKPGLKNRKFPDYGDPTLRPRLRLYRRRLIGSAVEGDSGINVQGR